MKTFHIKLHWIPELYFILVSILWYYVSRNQNGSAVQQVNFTAILLIVVFHIQLFLNDALTGMMLSIIIGIASIGISVLVLRDIAGTFLYDSDTQWYALKAGNIMLLNGIMAYIMYRKYRIAGSKAV